MINTYDQKKKMNNNKSYSGTIQSINDISDQFLQIFVISLMISFLLKFKNLVDMYFNKLFSSY